MRLSFVVIALVAVVFALGCKKESKRTPTGYEYIIQKNTGGAKPKVGDYVYFHAQMRIADSVANSSRLTGQAPFLQIMDASATPEPGKQSSPIEEVLRDMAVGDSVTIIINIDTIPNKPQGFENVKELYYDVVAIEIKSKEEFEKTAAVEREKQQADQVKIQAREQEVASGVATIVSQYKSGAINSQLKTTASGLKYLMVAPGTGKQAEAQKKVSVNYYGVLAAGERFDDSFSRGIPFSFVLGNGMVIPGWDEGIALLKEGGKAYLFIPAALGYGAAGSPPAIPANAELIFYVELDKVE